MVIWCRLCAEERNPDEIKTTIDDIGLSIATKLNICCKWETLQPDDVLPKQLCHFCFDKLEMSWEFAQSVSIAQTKLNAIFGKLLFYRNNPKIFNVLIQRI